MGGAHEIHDHKQDLSEHRYPGSRANISYRLFTVI
ncbi:MAG: hypothetical protein UU29_C0004G0003 [Candidatus Daviesbacteria bacterium GW2011_GWA2_40_9]|uniref:Uncharacterized protein n=1 Tax=Candidatus Daviesbacteria bacterium GW2011_GWA2_40_9 TaxID=1618424 RepID=A0A0G0X789_9BACT|nr:MAG: hypothetical protein UU29_C0004G0003 [Candidatus Daviesbacteria bacterium GW2011_GWA2_40_9]